MSDVIWLSKAQMRRIEPNFPLLHGALSVDDHRLVGGIIFVARNRDAPANVRSICFLRRRAYT